MWILLSVLAAGSERCTYTPTVWNVHAREARVGTPVDKARSALEPREVGPLGCTPCLQDQRTLTLSNGVELQVCHRVADDVQAALEDALALGVPVDTALGYRPSLSRGDPDANGDRTRLSLHAFGVAIDINREQNGLYNDCLQWSSGCRLSLGGPWRPGEDPRSLTPDSPLVRRMHDLGWHWGGELDGRQKDFMHFAVTTESAP